MEAINNILKLTPYSLGKDEKQIVLTTILKDLSEHHYNNSPRYRKMIDALGIELTSINHYSKLPYLPVRLFKMMDLLSVNKEEVTKTMTSSGTSGQAVSRIYLDRETAANQIKVLTKIVSSFIGNKRTPMLIIDTDSIFFVFVHVKNLFQNTTFISRLFTLL